MAIWLTASIEQHYKNENFKQSLQKIQLTASVKQYCSLSYKVIKKNTHTHIHTQMKIRIGGKEIKLPDYEKQQ